MAVDCQQPEKEPKMTLYFISQLYFLCLRARKICRPVQKNKMVPCCPYYSDNKTQYCVAVQGYGNNIKHHVNWYLYGILRHFLKYHVTNIINVKKQTKKQNKQKHGNTMAKVLRFFLVFFGHVPRYYHVFRHATWHCMKYLLYLYG